MNYKLTKEDYERFGKEALKGLQQEATKFIIYQDRIKQHQVVKYPVVQEVVILGIGSHKGINNLLHDTRNFLQ